MPLVITPSVRQDGNPQTTNTPSPTQLPSRNTQGKNSSADGGPGSGIATRLALVGIIMLTVIFMMLIRRSRMWRRLSFLFWTRVLGREPRIIPGDDSGFDGGSAADWPRRADALADVLPMPDLDVREKAPDDAPDVCLICLDDLNTQPVAAGPCGHWAHAECLRMWLAKDAARTCPACRRPMTGPAAPPPRGEAEQQREERTDAATIADSNNSDETDANTTSEESASVAATVATTATAATSNTATNTTAPNPGNDSSSATLPPTTAAAAAGRSRPADVNVSPSVGAPG